MTPHAARLAAPTPDTRTDRGRADVSDEDRLREIHDAVGWDDRKALAWLWQDHAPLPPGGLSDEFYSALIAVAEWGAGVMYDRTLTPVQPPADHGDGSGAGGREGGEGV